MKTANETANELIQKFIEPTKVPNIKGVFVDDLDGAKQCALISITDKIEFLESFKSVDEHEYQSNLYFLEDVRKYIESFETD